MCICDLALRMSGYYVCAWGMWRPEVGIGFPWTGVTDGFELESSGRGGKYGLDNHFRLIDLTTQHCYHLPVFISMPDMHTEKSAWFKWFTNAC